MWQLGREPEPHRRSPPAGGSSSSASYFTQSQTPPPLERGDLNNSNNSNNNNNSNSNSNNNSNIINNFPSDADVSKPSTALSTRTVQGPKSIAAGASSLLRPAPPVLEPLRPRGGAHPPTHLASSVHLGAGAKAPAASAHASHAYQWTPCQVHHNQSATCSTFSGASGPFAKGIYVNSLTMEMRKETFDGAVPHLFRLDPQFFVPRGTKPWCYLLKGSIPCIVVKGVVVCTAEPAGPGSGPLPVGQLPEDMRPTRRLRIAAVVRRPTEAGTSSQLITLQVQPDGMIYVEAGRRDFEEVVKGCEIDLSSIRFCRGNGMSLVDDVNLYLCDVNGTRVICLQGELHERFFLSEGRKPLSLLPSSCQPQEEMFFACPGTSGGFHLLLARPKGDARTVGAGDLVWRDSHWHRDTISLDGMMWEVAPAALLFANPMKASKATESQLIAILDFQRYLCRRFGTVEEAWEKAFDTDGSGSVNFTEFGLGCKAAGYVGNSSKLWAALDIDRSGAISIEELGADTENTLQVMQGVKTRQMLEEQREFEETKSRPGPRGSVGHSRQSDRETPLPQQIQQQQRQQQQQHQQQQQQQQPRSPSPKKEGSMCTGPFGRQLSSSLSTQAPASYAARNSVCSSACSYGNRWNPRPTTTGTVLDVLEKSLVRRQLESGKIPGGLGALGSLSLGGPGALSARTRMSHMSGSGPGSPSPPPYSARPGQQRPVSSLM